MANSDVSNPGDALYDPWEYTLIKDWITNYVRFTRISPELTERFANNAAEFKMIPIPNKLFDSLRNFNIPTTRSSSSGFPGFGPQAGFTDPTPYYNEKLSKLEVARHFDHLAQLATAFADDIESGDIKKAMSVISDDYLDVQSRGKDQLLADIQKLLESTQNRKLILAHVDEFSVIGEKICTKVSGAWKALMTADKKAYSEIFTLELIFQLSNDRQWKISSIEIV